MESRRNSADDGHSPLTSVEELLHLHTDKPLYNCDQDVWAGRQGIGQTLRVGRIMKSRCCIMVFTSSIQPFKWRENGF